MTAPAAQRLAHYVYGVVPAGRPLPPLDDTGVEPDLPPRLLADGPLAALTSPVRVAPESEDSEPDAESVLERVLAHETLLERVLDHGLPVVPFRFGSAYAEEEDVVAFLQAHRTALLEALAHVDGRVELGVKAYVDPAAVAEAVRASDGRLRALEAELAQASPGAAHLRRKQVERLAVEASAAERTRLAATLHERLSATAVDARTNVLPEPAEGLVPVLNGAYLVARENEAALRSAANDAAAEYAALGARISVTGPWPAYNFVELERDGGR